jgi:hypothetical protein
MGTYSMSEQLRAGGKRWLCDALRAPELLFRAARRGFLNTRPIGLAGLALLLTTAARGEQTPQGPGGAAGSRSTSRATAHLSEPQLGLLEVGAIGLLALLLAQLTRTKESWNGRQTKRLSQRAERAGGAMSCRNWVILRTFRDKGQP